MAEFITWKPYYSVNDPELDAEHRQIIECINQLYQHAQSMMAGAVTRQVLDRLVQYTRTHFEHEEERLQEIGFANFGAHKALHDQMRQRTAGLRANLSLVTFRDVLSFLKEWWVDHIQGEDRQYAGHLMSLTAAK
jgi:hemerythrin-like metal-binding protein